MAKNAVSQPCRQRVRAMRCENSRRAEDTWQWRQHWEAVAAGGGPQLPRAPRLRLQRFRSRHLFPPPPFRRRHLAATNAGAPY